MAEVLNVVEAEVVPVESDQPVEQEVKVKASTYIRETSSVGSPVALVHIIASEMPEAARKDVIAACRAQGVAFGTARTQYQRWRQNTLDAKAAANAPVEVSA